MYIYKSPLSELFTDLITLYVRMEAKMEYTEIPFS